MRRCGGMLRALSIAAIPGNTDLAAALAAALTATSLAAASLAAASLAAASLAAASLAAILLDVHLEEEVQERGGVHVEE